MKLFQRKTAEEKFIEQEMKKLADKQKRTLKLAEYAGTLETCKATFERTNEIERLNALKRRKAKLSDNGQKTLIHDACVGLLAVQEAEFELASARSAQDEAAAEKALKRMLGKLYRIDRVNNVSKKEYKESLGMEFDDSTDPNSFTDRAGLVDERFVEWIIEGYTMKECLDKCMPSAPAAVSSVSGVDFSAPPADENAVDDFELLKGDADAR